MEDNDTAKEFYLKYVNDHAKFICAKFTENTPERQIQGINLLRDNLCVRHYTKLILNDPKSRKAFENKLL